MLLTIDCLLLVVYDPIYPRTQSFVKSIKVYLYYCQENK